MKEHKNTPKFKHIREKNYDSSHPLYDAMKAICNPEGENSGHTAEYNGMTFQLYMCRDTYYDEEGVPQREVSVMGLNEQEDRWHVYRYNAEELAKDLPVHQSKAISLKLTRRGVYFFSASTHASSNCLPSRQARPTNRLWTSFTIPKPLS